MSAWTIRRVAECYARAWCRAHAEDTSGATYQAALPTLRGWQLALDRALAREGLR